MNSAAVRAFANTARDGWIGLPQPTWVQPGTVVTSINAVSSQHGTVSQIRLAYGSMTAPDVPNPYGLDCSYAGFPSP